MNEYTPRVGDVVHYYNFNEEHSDAKGQPWAGTVTHVWSPTCVDLSVPIHTGFPLKDAMPSSVELFATPEDVAKGTERYCLVVPPRD